MLISQMGTKINFQFQFRESGQHAPFRHGFDQHWLQTKIAQNLARIGVHAYLSNGYIHLLLNFNSRKLGKVKLFSPLFDQVWLRSKIAWKSPKVYFLSYILNGYLNPLSNLNSERVNKSEFLNLGLTNLEQGLK